MIRLIGRQRSGPIGIDVGARSIKLVQFSADEEHLVDAARWDFPNPLGEDPLDEASRAELVNGLRQVTAEHHFRGRDVVVCLSQPLLVLQNIRVPRVDGPELEKLVRREAATRIPFGMDEAEIRFIEAADVRQGDEVMREVILLACQKPRLTQLLETFETAGLRPVAVDVEPAALVRGFCSQFRRDEDRDQRAMFVHIGYSNTAAVLAQGDNLLFVKNIDIGGRHLDEAVAGKLDMDLKEAAALRRHNGDRREDQRDPEVAHSVQHATRAVLERLSQALSLCVRYHSVTFRGSPLTRIVLGGGEASPELTDFLQQRLEVKCELSDPLRRFTSQNDLGRRGQWDVAAGLAMRNTQ